MKCKACGAELKASAKFCDECGTEVIKNKGKKREETKGESPVYSRVNTERVTRYPDGKYRWVYEYPMLKNPILFFTIMKVFCLCALAPALVGFVADGGSDGFVKAFIKTAETFVIVAGIMAVLTFIGYLVVAAGYGWKYLVVFVMDETGVHHIQQAKQFEKAQVIGVLTALAGAKKGKPAAVGQGLMVASGGSLSSDFRVVRKIKGYPHGHMIKVNSLFSKNQIYVPAEDYDFVWDYITSRCPNAKIR